MCCWFQTSPPQYSFQPNEMEAVNNREHDSSYISYPDYETGYQYISDHRLYDGRWDFLHQSNICITSLYNLSSSTLNSSCLHFLLFYVKLNHILLLPDWLRLLFLEAMKTTMEHTMETGVVLREETVPVTATRHDWCTQLTMITLKTWQWMAAGSGRQNTTTLQTSTTHSYVTDRGWPVRSTR